jgi:copper chaperone CopZ
MTYGGCAASIKQALSRVPGVSSLEANPSNKDVVVDASAV